MKPTDALRVRLRAGGYWERDEQSSGAPRTLRTAGGARLRPGKQCSNAPRRRQADAASRVPRRASKLLVPRARSRSSVPAQGAGGDEHSKDGYKATAFTASASNLPAHVINLADVPTYVAEELRQFDANDDGLITVEEVLKKGAEIAQLNYKVRARACAQQRRRRHLLGQRQGQRRTPITNRAGDGTAAVKPFACGLTCR